MVPLAWLPTRRVQWYLPSSTAAVSAVVCDALLQNTSLLWQHCCTYIINPPLGLMNQAQSFEALMVPMRVSDASTLINANPVHAEANARYRD